VAGDDPRPRWPLGELVAGRASVIPLTGSEFGTLPTGAWAEPPVEGLLLPIPAPGHIRPYGFLVVGLNRYTPLDSEYRSFAELLAQHLSAGIAGARTVEAERRRALQLEELDRAKTAFFSNVSHEFRTPLTLMLGPLEDALAADAGGLDLARVELVHRNALRLLKLVNALLDFSRAEAGRMRAEFRPTDVCRLTSQLAGIPRGDRARRSGADRLLRRARAGGLRGSRSVGADRAQPDLQRVQGHTRGSRQGRGQRGRGRHRAGRLGHRRGHPTGGDRRAVPALSQRAQRRPQL
jgi:signal transduction histidine kinase